MTYGKLRHLRHHGADAAAREVAVADFAALRRAHHARLAHRERREVVVQHERLFALARQRVDQLRVAAGAERRGDERLRLAAREERRAVGARQHAGLHGDLAHRIHVAAVDARLAGKDAATHEVVLEAADLVGDLAGGPLRRVAGGERLDGRLLDLADARLARQLLDDRIGLAQFRCGQLGHGGGHVGVDFGCSPVPGRLAGLLGQFADRVDRDLHLLVAVDDCAEHHVFGEDVGFGLDHQHRVGRAGDDEVELRVRHVLGDRVQHVLAVDVGDARGADRALERDTGERERRGGAEHRGNVGIDFRVE